MNAKDLIDLCEKSQKKDEQNIQYCGNGVCPSCKGRGHTGSGPCLLCRGSGLVQSKKPTLVNLGSQERPITPSKGKSNLTKDPSFL